VRTTARTLKLIEAPRPPSVWSEVIVGFIRRMCWRYGSASTWDSRDALRPIESNGGRLSTIAPNELRYLRSQLLEVQEADDFL